MLKEALKTGFRILIIDSKGGDFLDDQKPGILSEDLRENRWGKIFASRQKQYRYLRPLFYGPENTPVYLVCQDEQQKQVVVMMWPHEKHGLVVVEARSRSMDRLFSKLERAEWRLNNDYVYCNATFSSRESEYCWNNRSIAKSKFLNYDQARFFPCLREKMVLEGSSDQEFVDIGDGDYDWQEVPFEELSYNVYVLDYGDFDVCRAMPLSNILADGQRVSLKTAAWLARDFLTIMRTLWEMGLLINLRPDMLELDLKTGQLRLMTLGVLLCYDDSEDTSFSGSRYVSPDSIRERFRASTILQQKLVYHAFDCVAVLLGALRFGLLADYGYFYEMTEREKPFVEFISQRQWDHMRWFEGYLKEICRLSYEAWGEIPKRELELLERDIQL